MQGSVVCPGEPPGLVFGRGCLRAAGESAMTQQAPAPGSSQVTLADFGEESLRLMNEALQQLQERTRDIGHEHKDLQKANRAHLKAVEHCLPYGLLILALAQLSPYAQWLPVLVTGFIAAKLLHAYSMLASGKIRIRQLSASVMYLFELAGCLILIGQLMAVRQS